ncbi:TetR/AcrR family transcriptional regulator, partial [Desulfobacter sp.]|uniref:TetR/AcrR family transcriptional regulator n=1 Tax=Desulfobacter sp. TaxID=2294 RepID=UPI003D0B1B80
MQKSKSEKYHKILNSAGAVFAEHGFYKATISQIAARAGVADGTLYLYFKNKDDILYQYLSFKTEVVFEKMNAAVANGTDAESKLRKLIRCHLQEFQNDKNMAIIF